MSICKECGQSIANTSYRESETIEIEPVIPIKKSLISERIKDFGVGFYSIVPWLLGFIVFSGSCWSVGYCIHFIFPVESLTNEFNFIFGGFLVIVIFSMVLGLLCYITLLITENGRKKRIQRASQTVG